ncbi:nuclear transport factor 2 family protein [Nocardioides limicola]|uniref:nuclear transport factor 2 family protein n=1 Tax=Nocardioides limicola TaxID=2803368 RepID=UPI00193BA12B|nr:nuclear transport factor 2 family protein [Nocardioides sp. DJM-14]
MTAVPEPVQAMVDAINAGDTEAFVQAFTADGFIDDWGNVRRGPDGVRSWASTDAIGQQARMSVVEAEVVGDRVTTTFEWASNRFNGTSTGIFDVADGRIAGFTIGPH